MVLKVHPPQVDIDGYRSVSIDGKSTYRKIASRTETLRVEYMFSTSEIDLDDEFRNSALIGNDKLYIDATDYPWINNILVCSMNGESFESDTSSTGSYTKRSFEALILERQ